MVRVAQKWPRQAFIYVLLLLVFILLYFSSLCFIPDLIYWIVAIERSAYDTSPPLPRFVPGTFVSIKAPGLPGFHPATISSAPSDRYIRIHVRVHNTWS